MKIGDKYKIEADSLNVTLSEKRTNKKTNEDYWTNIGYYSRYGHALKAMADLEVSKTGLKDFKTVCDKQEEIYALIDSLKVSEKGVKQ